MLSDRSGQINPLGVRLTSTRRSDDSGPPRPALPRLASPRHGAVKRRLTGAVSQLSWLLDADSAVVWESVCVFVVSDYTDSAICLSREEKAFKRDTGRVL